MTNGGMLNGCLVGLQGPGADEKSLQITRSDRYSPALPAAIPGFRLVLLRLKVFIFVAACNEACLISSLLSLVFLILCYSTRFNCASIGSSSLASRSSSFYFRVEQKFIIGGERDNNFVELLLFPIKDKCFNTIFYFTVKNKSAMLILFFCNCFIN